MWRVCVCCDFVCQVVYKSSLAACEARFKAKTVATREIDRERERGGDRGEREKDRGR